MPKSIPKNQKLNPNNPLEGFPPLSSSKARKAWEEAAWQKFTHLLHREKSFLNFKKALTRFISPSEKRKIALRLISVARLRQGISYRKIADELQIAQDTISATKKASQAKSYKTRWKRKQQSARRKHLRLLKKELAFKDYQPDLYQKTKYGKIKKII